MTDKTVNVNGVDVRPEGVLKTSDGEVGVILHHIVGEDGLSEKERNTKKPHAIPLYSLVEIQYNSEEDGLRLYVQGHTRDCDGTPLYDLTHDYRVIGKEVCLSKIKKNLHPLEHMMTVVDTGRVTGGYSDSCLTVIKTADEVKARLVEKGYMNEEFELV